MSLTNEILDALLEDDSEDAELLKHVASGPTEEELNVQLGVMETEDAGEYKDVYPQGIPRNFIPFGTLVHGTMREEDLIPDFLDAIEKVDPVKAADLRKNYAVEIAAGDVEFCWETLLTALNRYVPEFAYFGAHPGNGSDFGVWPDQEAIREAAEFEPEKMRTIAQGVALPTGSQYVAILNGDGYAVALIDGASGQELWSYDG